MKEFLSSNWPYIVVALVYIAERAQYLSADKANIIRKLVTVIRGKDIGVVAPDNSATKDAMIDAGLYHSPDIDAALDVVKPEVTPRVSKGKRFLNGFLKVLPVVTRFAK
jgi:hypothetical protein